MPKEIERKFLVDHNAWASLDKPVGKPYRQGYILSEKTRSVRVRIAGDQGFLTIKGKGHGISNDEFEYHIPLDEAVELLENFTDNGTEKIRYEIPAGPHTWEVDVFGGENEGLIVAEIELESEDDKFEKPSWVKEEVSHDPRYFNTSLAKHPYSKW